MLTHMTTNSSTLFAEVTDMSKCKIHIFIKSFTPYSFLFTLVTQLDIDNVTICIYLLCVIFHIVKLI